MKTIVKGILAIFMVIGIVAMIGIIWQMFHTSITYEFVDGLRQNSILTACGFCATIGTGLLYWAYKRIR